MTQGRDYCGLPERVNCKRVNCKNLPNPNKSGLRYIICLFFLADFLPVGIAPTESSLPEDRDLVSCKPNSVLLGSKQLDIYPRLPTKAGCNIRSSLTWGTRARTFVQLVQKFTLSPQLRGTGNFLVCFSLPNLYS